MPTHSHYAIRFGLSGPSQPELLQALGKIGAESIQTSNGLCVKTQLTRAELEIALKREKMNGVELSELTSERAPDVAAFVKKA
jgi:hypothetical protein